MSWKSGRAIPAPDGSPPPYREPARGNRTLEWSTLDEASSAVPCVTLARVRSARPHSGMRRNERYIVGRASDLQELARTPVHLDPSAVREADGVALHHAFTLPASWRTFSDSSHTTIWLQL